jgi:glucose/arabinose dehydrogenase
LVVTNGLTEPVYVTHAGDGSGRIFVVEQAERIRISAKRVLIGEPFLDITSRVLSGGEHGLLGLASHPRFQQNGRFFVNYTRKPDGATVVSEFRMPRAGDPPSSSEHVLIVIAQPYPNHNGGMVRGA